MTKHGLSPVEGDAEPGPEVSRTAAALPASAAPRAAEPRPTAVQSAVRSGVKRRATVRYYSRMTPQRSYPLLVAISGEALQQVNVPEVEQRSGEAFRVAPGSVVDVEPLLPGCSCCPPVQRVRVSGDTVTASFWVAPGVLGPVTGARVRLRQRDETLSEVPLDMRVSRRTLVVLTGLAALLVPYLSALLRHYHLDFDSQLKDGFVAYADIGQQVLTCLSPTVWLGCLLGATAVSFLWLRPRQREQFWDVRKQTDGVEAT